MGLAAIETEILGQPQKSSRTIKRERTIFILRVDSEGFDIFTHEKISGKDIDKVRERENIYAIAVTKEDNSGNLIQEKTIFIGDGLILSVADALNKDQYVKGTLREYQKLGITQIVSLNVNGYNIVKPFKSNDVLVTRSKKP